jgi:hypothetical protein
MYVCMFICMYKVGLTSTWMVGQISIISIRKFISLGGFLRIENVSLHKNSIPWNYLQARKSLPLTKNCLKNFYLVCCTKYFDYFQFIVTLWTNDSFFIFFIKGHTTLCCVLPLLQFRNFVWLLGRGISKSQGRYLYTEQHKHRTNTHTDIYALSGIRTHDSSNRVREDNSCARRRGHRDWHNKWLAETNFE